MTDRRPEDVFRAGSFALGMAVFADREAAAGVHETYDFDIEGERFHLRVEVRGESPADLVAEGAMTGEGSLDAARNCLTIFRPPPRPGAPP